MEPEAILDLMKRYFQDKQPTDVMDTFGDQSPRSLLKESLDVVEFIVHLEDEFGREIDVDELGETLVNSNFRQLSVEVSRLLAQTGA